MLELIGFTIFQGSLLQQQQQRSARIDLIMKLFPENGNSLNSTQSHQSSGMYQRNQHQQQL